MIKKSYLPKKPVNPFVLLAVIFLPVLIVTPSVPSGPTSSSGLADDFGSASPVQALRGLNNPVTGKIYLSGTVDVSALPSVASVPTRIQSILPAPSDKGGLHSSPPSPKNSPIASSLISPSVITYPGFNGLNESQSGFFTPPDVQVAAGPSNLVEMVNVEGAIFSKQGSVLQYLNLSSFFNIPKADSISDPKVLYDTSSGRWFASITIGSCNRCIANVTVAVSSGSDPRSSWNLYRLSLPAGVLADQPLIGISDDKFVVSANDVGSASTTGAQVLVLSKAEMLAGLSSIDLASFGPDVALFSVHPVQSLSPTSTLFMVSVGANGERLGGVAYCNSCTIPELFAISGSPPGPVTINSFPLPVLPVNAPPPIVEFGGTVITDQIDSRVLDATWFKGKLWFSLMDGCIPQGDTIMRDCVRLVQVNTNTIAVVQNMEFCQAVTNCFFPALRTDAFGNLAIIYGFSSATVYPSLALTGQAVGDPANSLRQPAIVLNGTSNDLTTRYGDYFGAALDPSDQTLIWTGGEYATNTSSCSGCWVTFLESMRVLNNGFALSTSAPSSTFTPGHSVSSPITVASLAGTGTVNLSVSVASPELSSTISPASVVLASGGSANATLTISSTTHTLAGTYLVNVTGSSGTYVVQESVYEAIRSFSIASLSQAISLSAGSQISANLTLSSINGFAGATALRSGISPATSNAPTVSISPSTVTLAVAASGSSTITISTTNMTPAGIYTISINASRASEFHVINIPLAVTTLSISFSNTTTFTGITVVTSATFSVDSPSRVMTMSGSGTVIASNATTGSLLFKRTYNVTTAPVLAQSNGAYLAKILLDILVNPYPLSSGVSITFSGISAPAYTVRVNRNPDINQNGVVSSVDLNLIQASRGCQQGMPCYNPKADLNADNIINLADSLICSYFINVQDSMPDFSIGLSSTYTTAGVGIQTSDTIALTSRNNFTGTISLSSSTIPSGIATSLIPRNITLSGGGSATSTLALNSTTAGVYTVTIAATSSNVTHTATLTISIVDFAISTSTPSQNYFAGYTSYIVLGSINGFTGTIVFTSTSTPSQPALQLTITPTSLPLAGYGTGTTIENSNAGASCPSGQQKCQWSVTVTGTSGNLSHSLSISVLICRPPSSCPIPSASVQPAFGHHPGPALYPSVITSSRVDSVAKNRTSNPKCANSCLAREAAWPYNASSYLFLTNGMTSFRSLVDFNGVTQSRLVCPAISNGFPPNLSFRTV